MSERSPTTERLSGEARAAADFEMLDELIDDPELALAERRNDYLRWIASMPTERADKYVLGVLATRLVTSGGIDKRSPDSEVVAAIYYIRQRLAKLEH